MLVNGICPSDQAAELARHLVVMALGQNSLGRSQLAIQLEGIGSGRKALTQRLHLAPCGSRLANPRAAKHCNGLIDPMPKQKLGFDIVQLQAHAAQVVFSQEGDVGIGRPVVRAIQDRLHAPQGVGIFLDRLRLSPRQRLAALQGWAGVGILASAVISPGPSLSFRERPAKTNPGAWALSGC